MIHSYEIKELKEIVRKKMMVNRSGGHVCFGVIYQFMLHGFVQRYQYLHIPYH